MVYVERFKVKGEFYYRLVHNIRKGKRVLHKTRYIGKSLPTKDRLEQLKDEFLKDIYGHRYKYLSNEDVKLIEKKKTEHWKEIKRLSKAEKEKALKEFIVRYTYDSSKLAGVDVSLRQTSLILRDKIIPKEIKDLKTVKELENQEKGFVAITKYKGTLNLKFVKKLHKILLSGVDDGAGKTRYEIKRNVKITGTSYVPPKWGELPKLLGNFFKWYKAENRRLHPIELAALVHLKMIAMQPFVDGNSRLSRLLMNWVLWRKKYPYIDIPVKDLENYYDAIDKYELEGWNEKPFINYIRKRFLIG